MDYVPLIKKKEAAIVVVHGMGVHKAPTAVEPTKTAKGYFKPGEFGQEFIDTSAAIMNAYADYKGASIADYYDIHEVNYDGWFDEMRTIMANNAKSMSERLGVLSGKFGETIPFGLVERLTSLESQFGGDKFFYTHWLDVIFYASMLGAKVRADAAAVIADAVAQYDASNVHIIAHSLGTAVTHDTLAAMYQGIGGKKIKKLDPVTHQLRSVWMFANVSRLVYSVAGYANPLKSVVRPGDGGCATTFVNVRHELDPFTWLAQFNPQNDESWIPSPSYSNAYSNIVTQLVVDPNTHSFPQYLQDPLVSATLLKFLLFPDFRGTDAEIAKARADRSDQSLPMMFPKLQDALQNAVKSDTVEGWKTFLENAKLFVEKLKGLGGFFKT